MEYSNYWKEKVLEWISGASFLPAPATNNKSMFVSLWSGDRVVATQPAEFVDGVNANTIDFGTVNASFIDGVTVNGVEVTINYSTDPKRSPQPENPANREGESWQESEQICPDCGQLLWTASWWDDSSDNGGRAIGTLFECGNCGYRDSI